MQLTVTGFNSEKCYKTKIVEVPVSLGGKTHKIPAICTPEINISLNLKGLKHAAETFRERGYRLADSMINSDKIDNLKFILGTKSSYILKCTEKSFGVKNDSFASSHFRF